MVANLIGVTQLDVGRMKSDRFVEFFEKVSSGRPSSAPIKQRQLRKSYLIWTQRFVNQVTSIRKLDNRYSANCLFASLASYQPFPLHHKTMSVFYCNFA
ncbi:MAG: hypothetical protein NZ805_08570 [Armatimonadetes bacterium]|nr:hypothetical protein [Armatimonadota bacterium]MDW8028747.1 hypothetical protein [Armatimonadota bacterium]